MVDIRQYPEILTNKNWQKKKGLLAKTKGETGVGDAMDKAEAAYKKIDFAKLDASLALPLPNDRRDKNRIAEAKEAARKHYQTTVPAVRAAIGEIAKCTISAANEWKKSKVVPDSSVKHAEAVAAQAGIFAGALAGNSPEMTALLDAFDQLTLLIDKKKEIFNNEDMNFPALLKTLEGAIEKYTKDEKLKFTKQGWMKASTPSMHNALRSMCNAIKVFPKINQHYWATWQPLGDFYQNNAPDGEGETAAMKQKLKTVVEALSDFKKNYQSMLN